MDKSISTRRILVKFTTVFAFLKNNVLLIATLQKYNRKINLSIPNKLNKYLLKKIMVHLKILLQEEYIWYHPSAQCIHLMFVLISFCRRENPVVVTKKSFSRYISDYKNLPAKGIHYISVLNSFRCY